MTYPVRNKVEERTAVTMQAICRRQCPRRIKYQPQEIKTVLTKFREAFRAGKSEMVIVASKESENKRDLPDEWV